jgi:hypothetical protein
VGRSGEGLGSRPSGRENEMRSPTLSWPPYRSRGVVSSKVERPLGGATKGTSKGGKPLLAFRSMSVWNPSSLSLPRPLCRQLSQAAGTPLQTKQDCTGQKRNLLLSLAKNSQVLD